MPHRAALLFQVYLVASGFNKDAYKMMDVDALLSADGPFLGRLEPSPEESHAVATMSAVEMGSGLRCIRSVFLGGDGC